MSLVLGFTTLFVSLVVVLWFASTNPRVSGPLLVGFFARAALALVDTLVVDLPGAGDGVGWDHVATYWARGGLASVMDHVSSISANGAGQVLYIWLMSLLYAILAPSRLMVQSINVLLGSLTILVVWKIAKTVDGDDGRANRAAWFTALVPSLIFFSSVLLREVAVSFPLALCLMYLVRWYNERKSSQLILALAFLLVSMSFHSGGVAVLLFAGLWLIGSWFRAMLAGRFRQLGKSTLALAVGLIVVAGVLASGFGLQKFKGLDTGDVQVLAEKQSNFAIGRTAYLEDLHADSPVDLLWQAPIRLVYFLFAPFPWMLHSPSDAFGLVDSVLFFVLITRAIRNRKSIADNPGAALVLGVFAAMAVVFAIGVSNYGTALRHRSKMLPLLIAASVAMPAARKRRNGAPSALQSSLGAQAGGLSPRRT